MRRAWLPPSPRGPGRFGPGVHHPYGRSFATNGIAAFLFGTALAKSEIQKRAARSAVLVPSPTGCGWRFLIGALSVKSSGKECRSDSIWEQSNWVPTYLPASGLDLKQAAP